MMTQDTARTLNFIANAAIRENRKFTVAEMKALMTVLNQEQQDEDEEENRETYPDQDCGD